MVGLSASEDISRKNFADFYVSEARRLVLEQGIGTAVAESFWSGETTLLSPARGLVPISQVIVAHKETDGAIKYFSTIARDISKLKRLEEQFLRAQKMEAVGRLAGGVAHDFNNLLTVIMGFSEALIKSLEPGDARHEQAQQIKRSSERAAALTRQLLTFSRHQGIEPQTLHLGELVARMSKMLGHIIGEDIELITRIDSNLNLIKADPGQMEQVVMNLVVNARDAMPTGGKITIEAANVQVDTQQAQFHLQLCPGEYVRLSVHDTGCGMDERTQSHLFEPFFTTKEMGKGTGLGLAIVYGVVQQNQGYLEVQSTPGQGSDFRIYFPVSRHHTSFVGRPAPVPSPQSKGTETVLVVEDQEGVRSLVRQSLEAEGYHVLVASDGQEALATCNSAMRPIHLLLTDVVMPRMSGPQLAKSIGNLSPATKVLYMSGFADSALSRHGALAEGIDCLMKPFTPEVLVRMVRDVLDGRRVAGMVNGH
jgi:signal transduction histidine kinase/CheY-like chemotaxis protein